MPDMEAEFWWLRPEISGVDPALIPANRTGPVAVPEVAMAVPTLGPKPELPDADKKLLAKWVAMRHKVLTAVRQLVDGDTTAFFIWGPGGHGKSQIVAEGLRDHEKVRWHRGDMSALGLFLALQEFPDHVHVLEDMEKLYKEQGAQQVLRAACVGVDGGGREVKWEKAGQARQEPFVFEGGIIVVSNDDPRGGNLKLGAIASRFSPVEWRLLDPELAAVMRHLAIKDTCPYDYSPEVRLEVAEFVIAQMDERPELIHVDLRTFKEHAMPAYHQWRQGRTVGDTTWQDVVRMKIEGSPRPKTRESRVEADRRVACEVYLEGKDTEERHKLWKDRTGLGSTAFHDRLKEARESGLFDAVKDTWAGPK